jgi:hypothetical protein
MCISASRIARTIRAREERRRRRWVQVPLAWFYSLFRRAPNESLDRDAIRKCIRVAYDQLNELGRSVVLGRLRRVPNDDLEEKLGIGKRRIQQIYHGFMKNVKDCLRR